MKEESWKYHKFGYCKYNQSGCRSQHYDEICEDGFACKNIKTCFKRHPRLCKKIIKEGFCRFGNLNSCAYSHPQDLITSNHNDLKTKVTTLEKTVQEMASKIIYLETQLMVKPDCTSPVFKSILSESYLETNYDGEDSEKISHENTHESKENNKSNTLIKKSEETITIHMNDEKMNKESTNQGQLFFCDMCSYKCKNKKTIEKHLHKKHENYKQCDLCDRNFTTEGSLTNHVHEDHENEHESSFVFSESMLDEFIDKDI